MKFNKISRKLAAALMAGAMMVSMVGMTAMAETGDVADGKVSFRKVLDMSEALGASVPTVTFNYTIAGIDKDIPATDIAPEILAGVGTPTIGTAVYAPVNDVTTEVDETALTKTVSVDFSNVKFSKPGIYRYVITEQAAENADITNDTNSTRYLDVYVVNDDNGGYKIASQALLKDNTMPAKDGGYDAAKKSTGYTNSYKTYSFSLDKVVAGTMGEKGRTYNFTIKFTGPANASFTYGAEKVQLDKNGTGSINIDLKDADAAATIKGIPSTVKYVVKENIPANDGYTTTYTVNGTSVNATRGIEEDAAYVNSAETTMGKQDNTVVCTNTKNAVTPTGVALTIAPYILMVALAGVFAFLFLRRRHSEF